MNGGRVVQGTSIHAGEWSFRARLLTHAKLSETLRCQYRAVSQCRAGQAAEPLRMHAHLEDSKPPLFSLRVPPVPPSRTSLPPKRVMVVDKGANFDHPHSASHNRHHLINPGSRARGGRGRGGVSLTLLHGDIDVNGQPGGAFPVQGCGCRPDLSFFL